MIKKNINRIDIAKNLSKKLGLSASISKKIIDNLILIFTENAQKSLNLKNIGSFKIIYKHERIGRNPKTKQPFKIKSRKAIKFTVSKNLIKKLNKF